MRDKARTFWVLLATTVLLAMRTYSYLNAATVPAAPSIAVLVNGQPANEHAIRGAHYVEAMVGTEYSIEIRNPYPRRIAVALSVDGLNTIDAKEGNGRLWILDPAGSYTGTVTIPGWQVSGATARKFVVSKEADSYARKLGKATTTGVIRAVFYEEQGNLTAYRFTGSVSGTTLLGSSSAVGNSIPVSAATSATLGTAMGATADHAVTEVEFRTGAEIGSVELHYVTPAALAALMREPPGRFCPEPERIGVLR